MKDFFWLICAYSDLMIAQRLAGLALKYIYGHPVLAAFSEIDSVKQITSTHVRMSFTNITDPVSTDYKHVETLPFEMKDANGVCRATELHAFGNRTREVEFDREIGLDAIIGYRKFTDLGVMPYDALTRFPVVPFRGVKAEKSFKNY